MATTKPNPTRLDTYTSNLTDVDSSVQTPEHSISESGETADLENMSTKEYTEWIETWNKLMNRQAGVKREP